MGADPGLSIFLCGDVMVGRGVDQILPHPANPELRERVVKDARTYVDLAEQTSGPIPKPVEFAWPWGDAVAVLDEFSPDARVLNLETSITGDGDYAPGKAIHYRMHPDNIGCLTVIRPDACALANNHILDFGYRGLADTLRALSAAGLLPVGAGLDAEQAQQPAVLSLRGGHRVVIAARGLASSGIPHRWSATASAPGVAFVPDLSKRSAAGIADRVLAVKRHGDVAVVSLHWGSNWGYSVEERQVAFAHRLIDAGVDVIHGHSSHHPRPIEVYRRKLILYGCGDTINDYEGIGGYQAYRDELRPLYFASIDPGSGELAALRMVPMRASRMRLERAPRDDAEWLRRAVEDASRSFGTRVDADADGVLTVRAA